jgi:ATP-dependent Lon protease
MQLLRLPTGTVKVLIEGKRRGQDPAVRQTEPYFLVEFDEIPETHVASVEIEALMRSVQSTFEMYVKLNKKIQPEVLMSVQAIDDPSRLADTIIANLPTIKLADRQGLLEMDVPKQRLERLIELMQAEIEILQWRRRSGAASRSRWRRRRRSTTSTSRCRRSRRSSEGESGTSSRTRSRRSKSASRRSG